MRTHLKFIVGAVFIFCSARLIAGAEQTAEITAILKAVREKYHLPALAGAVFDDNGLVAQGTAGVRKMGGSEPATQNDLWHLGSDAKAMTATLVGSYVADKRLDWQDRVEQFFPEFADEIHPALKGITIAQLLSHRAGLVANLDWSGFDQKDIIRSRRAAAKQLLTSAPASAVGEYQYSNSGYVVVGAILEKLGGKPWEQLLTDRIFTPLKMKSAGYGGTGTVGKIDQPWGHQDGKPVAANGPLIDNPKVLGPAGTVHASISDWAKFLTDQLRGATDQKALLPPAIYRTIQSPHPAGSTYGLGWSIGTRAWAGGTALSHTGSNTMNFSVCWLAPSKKFGVLVCTNDAGPQAEKATDAAAEALIIWHLKSRSE